MEKIITFLLLIMISSICYSASAIVVQVEDKKIGRIHSAKSVNDAVESALNECKKITNKECILLLKSGRPGWGAIAIGEDGFWVVLSENSRADAIISVMKECDNRFVGCKLIDVFFDFVAADKFPEIIPPHDYVKPENNTEEKSKNSPKKLKDTEILI
jgi:hypothetical protein